jgi:hypothetical protein
MFYLVVEGTRKALLTYEFVPRNNNHNTRAVLYRSLYLSHTCLGRSRSTAGGILQHTNRKPQCCYTVFTVCSNHSGVSLVSTILVFCCSLKYIKYAYIRKDGYMP